MKTNIEFIKTIFIIKSAQLSYPNIGWQSFRASIQELNIFDYQFTIETVDRIFIAVKN
jgi:hypothetical protein